MFNKKEKTQHYDFDMVTTRGGDRGKSSDYSGRSFPKDDLLFETLGTVDELNSTLGVAKHQAKDFKADLEALQQKLIELSSLAATDPRSELYVNLKSISEDDVMDLEARQKAVLDSGVVIEPHFVLPGGSPASSWLDLARTVCRRAERLWVRFMSEKQRPDLVQASIFLNRLSDYLFIAARAQEQRDALKA